MVSNQATVNQEEVSTAQVFEKIVNFFKEVNWLFLQVEDKPTLKMNYRGHNGQLTCYAQVLEEQKYFLFYSYCPVSVPEDKRLSVAEFLTRVNYRLIGGNFELDFANGEIAYKTSIKFEGINLESSVISHLVYANAATMDKYLPGIMKVIYSDVSAVEALAQIEGYQQLTDSLN